MLLGLSRISRRLLWATLHYVTMDDQDEASGPHPKAVSAWNGILEHHADNMPSAVGVFVAGLRRVSGRHPEASKIAADLELRLAISRKLGYRPWMPSVDEMRASMSYL